MKAIVVTAVIAYVCFAAFAWFASDRMIFLPPSPSYRAGQLPIVMVPADGGSIAARRLATPSRLTAKNSASLRALISPARCSTTSAPDTSLSSAAACERSPSTSSTGPAAPGANCGNCRARMRTL